MYTAKLGLLHQCYLEVSFNELCVLTLLNTLIAFDRDKVEFRVPFFICVHRQLINERPALANENST